jgi:hypothetical protein
MVEDVLESTPAARNRSSLKSAAPDADLKAWTKGLTAAVVVQSCQDLGWLAGPQKDSS